MQSTYYSPTQENINTRPATQTALAGWMAAYC